MGIADVTGLRIKLFVDGASLTEIRALSRQSHIAGFTTNPTLMRKAGVTDYLTFARAAVDAVADKPISFEVIADDLPTMDTQARTLSRLSPQVYVKIPITMTSGESTLPLIKVLALNRIKVNITAVMIPEQIRGAIDAVAGLAPSIVSIFAGRIADTGIDPTAIMQSAIYEADKLFNVEILWASPREVLNVYQANAIGCHIITVTPDLLNKLSLRGKDLAAYSRETVQMFYDDAQRAGLSL